MAGGIVTLNANNNLNYCELHFTDISLSLIYGVNTDPAIEQIIVETNGVRYDKSATIIHAENDLEIWFKLYRELLISPIRVIALSESGKTVYQTPPDEKL